MGGVKYQFTVDGKPKAPVRDTWDEAAEDAWHCRYGRWKNDHEFILDVDRGAKIVAVK